jgi:CDP-diacylglycerol--glycerol-3-phosphate 3-phosphatidyltransferase
MSPFIDLPYTKKLGPRQAAYTKIAAMNLPNGLTLMRIFLVPLLVAVLLTKYNVLIAAAIFLSASLTDLLDGYFARKREQVTTLGILLDPVADKLLISLALFRLCSFRLFQHGWWSSSSAVSSL